MSKATGPWHVLKSHACLPIDLLPWSSMTALRPAQRLLTSRVCSTTWMMKAGPTAAALLTSQPGMVACSMLGSVSISTACHSKKLGSLAIPCTTGHLASTVSGWGSAESLANLSIIQMMTVMVSPMPQTSPMTDGLSLAKTGGTGVSTESPQCCWGVHLALQSRLLGAILMAATLTLVIQSTVRL